MKILIKNGHLIDPSQGLDGMYDILISQGKIAEQTPRSTKGKGQKSLARIAGRITEGADLITIDAEGLLMLAGFVDMHVHLREPGFEYKETIQTGTEAAIAGGITSVCCMPNTKPVNDNSSVTEFIIRKAMNEGFCSVYPVGAITKGQKGEELAEFALMHDAGCVAFSDDGRPVMDSLVMRRALEYSKILNVPLISHCEDLSLSSGGVMNEGLLSVTLGLTGIPAQAEEIMTARDIALAELTGGRLHIAHVSTKGSVELIRLAKKRGIADITAETCPHYFSITEDAVDGYNTNAKVNPPLRRKADVEAIRKGLKDNVIDVIATDHAPHHHDEKLGEFDLAPSGISGFETSIGLSMRLVDDGVLTLNQLIEKMVLNPSKITGIRKGAIKEGEDADIVILDTHTEYTVHAATFRSKGRNTPFEGWKLHCKTCCNHRKGKDVFMGVKALLVLADGTVFEGRGFGAEGETIGEVVFNTSMTGYQEILTDASYKGQIVTMTYTQIGNYGVNEEDRESAGGIKAEGFIVKEACDFPSNWRSSSGLTEYMKKYSVVGIEGIDTQGPHQASEDLWGAARDHLDG